MKKNEQELVQLITKIQEHLLQIDRKLDVLASRCMPRPPEVKPSPKPFQPPVSAAPDIHMHTNGGASNNRPKERTLYAAVCADCKQSCQIPFKPSGDRPVYCQECFKRRKSGGVYKAPEPRKEAPPVTVPVSAPVKAPAAVAKTRKKSAARKVVARKAAPRKKKK